MKTARGGRDNLSFCFVHNGRASAELSLKVEAHMWCMAVSGIHASICFTYEPRPYGSSAQQHFERVNAIKIHVCNRIMINFYLWLPPCKIATCMCMYLYMYLAMHGSWWVPHVVLSVRHVLSCSNAIAGETSLDRLANALGGKAVLPHIIANIPQMLQSGELGVIVI